jgi:hypothetical protein
MGTRAKYSKYAPEVKAAVSMTGMPDLFPDLNIPRMTANYWISQNYALSDPVLEPLAEAVKKTRAEVEHLQIQLREKDALIELLREVSCALGLGLSWRQMDASETKVKILSAVEKAMKVASREKCLSTIALSLSRYKRWRRERRGCGITGAKRCPKGNVNQLTAREILVMRNLVTSFEYGHYPIRSLHYYAKRQNLLFCSYSTWRKYIDEFNWKRPRKIYRERKYLRGIRAQAPNEIWHLDLSYFVLPNRKKCYIQAIVDNYSRYVLAWQILDSFDGSKTGALIKAALFRSGNPIIENRPRLIVDGGAENKGPTVASIEAAGQIRKEVARFEITFSNSIVEAVFRSLKHNYLYHKEITCPGSLARHANFWFKEHNEKIPHTAFNGETPLERFSRSWNKENEIRIIAGQEAAMKLRISENQAVACEKCEVA